MRFVNKHNKIMAQNLTKGFVHHRRGRLAPQGIAKLALQHAEGRFHVAPLVVVLKEFLPLVHEVSEHLLQQDRCLSSGVPFKSDEGRSIVGSNRGDIGRASIGRICGDFGNRKGLRGTVKQRRQYRTIARAFLANRDGSDDVCFNSADNVGFEPLRLLLHLPVFVVKPAGVPGSTEAGRIDSKVGFHAGQRQTALPNQFEQNGRQSLIFEIIENRVVARNAGDHAAPVGFAEIAHKAASRETGINFERGSEYSIAQGQAGPSTSLDNGFLNAIAKLTEQLLELVLFASLGSVVRPPVLRVGLALGRGDGHRFSDRDGTIRVLFLYYHVSDCINVLAGQLPFFEIGTSANRLLDIGDINKITGIAGLRGNEPSRIPVLLDFPGFCNLLSTLFSCVHIHLAYLRSILLSRYIFVKGLLRGILLDSIFLSGICLVRYGTHHHQKTGLQMLALQPRMGATQEHQGQTFRLSEMQEPVLGQAAQGAEKQGTIELDIPPCQPLRSQVFSKYWAALRATQLVRVVEKLVRAVGFEPTTSGVRSPALYPTELRPHWSRVEGAPRKRLPFTRFLLKSVSPLTPPSASSTSAEFLANSCQLQQILVDRKHYRRVWSSCVPLVTATTACTLWQQSKSGNRAAYTTYRRLFSSHTYAYPQILPKSRRKLAKPGRKQALTPRTVDFPVDFFHAAQKFNVLPNKSARAGIS